MFFSVTRSSKMFYSVVFIIFHVSHCNSLIYLVLQIPFPTNVFFSVTHPSNLFYSVVFIIFLVSHCNSLIYTVLQCQFPTYVFFSVTHSSNMFYSVVFNHFPCFSLYLIDIHCSTMPVSNLCVFQCNSVI